MKTHKIRLTNHDLDELRRALRPSSYVLEKIEAQIEAPFEDALESASLESLLTQIDNSLMTKIAQRMTPEERASLQRSLVLAVRSMKSIP